GTATLTLGTVGSLQGTFSVTGGNSQLTIAASAVKATLATGDANAPAVNLKQASGTFTVTGGTNAGASGSATGTVTLDNVTGLTLNGTMSLTFDTTFAHTQFAIGGTAAVAAAGFNLTGTFAVQSDGTEILIGAPSFTAGLTVAGITLNVTGSAAAL